MTFRRLFIPNDSASGPDLRRRAASSDRAVTMDIQRLRRATKKSPLARSLFEHFATGENAGKENTVDDLLALLQRTGRTVRRKEIVATLQYLGSLGCGRFIRGTHGKSSRMLWQFDLRTLASIALERSDEPSTPIYYPVFRAGEDELTTYGRANSALSALPWNDILNESEGAA